MHTMITNSKEKAFPAAKQEAHGGDEKPYKASTMSSSRQWSSAGFRNPRIVRVSRTFGGKDRHSKVCTVRGLRDRRIRLSVPTAVQLYDLQDRLGLSQPSKVIDWLIDATKQDIDKLPPLQIPQGVFSQFLHPHDHHIHQNLNLLPPHDHHHHHHHHHQVKTDDQDQFAQKLLGLSSSYMNYYQNSDQTTSFLGPGIALPQIDGSHGNLVSHSSTTSPFNLTSIQSMSQLFFGSPYPPYLSTHDNLHDSMLRSQMMNNVQFLTTSSISTSTSTSASSQTQQYHVLNNSLMSSLHSTGTTSPNNINNPPLIKSFPAILNPRLLAQSSAYENRSEKDC